MRVILGSFHVNVAVASLVRIRRITDCHVALMMRPMISLVMYLMMYLVMRPVMRTRHLLVGVPMMRMGGHKPNSAPFTEAHRNTELKSTQRARPCL